MSQRKDDQRLINVPNISVIEWLSGVLLLTVKTFSSGLVCNEIHVEYRLESFRMGRMRSGTSGRSFRNIWRSFTYGMIFSDPVSIASRGLFWVDYFLLVPSYHQVHDSCIRTVATVILESNPKHFTDHQSGCCFSKRNEPCTSALWSVFFFCATAPINCEQDWRSLSKWRVSLYQ